MPESTSDDLKSAPPDAATTVITEPKKKPPRRSGPTAVVATLDRRTGADRRDGQPAASQFDRRRGPGRRRTDYRRDAEEGHMNEEQLEFIKSIDEYKRANHRPFPTWTEVLDIILYLGYRKVAPVGSFKLIKGRQTPLRKPRVQAPDPDAGDCDPPQVDLQAPVTPQ